MQKLFENWRKFLLTEVYELQNYQALLNTPVSGYYGDETFTKKYNLTKRPDIVNQIVKNIKVLQNNKIVKGMGAGKYGITYVLDNDHILKFYLKGHQPYSDNGASGDSDYKKFKEIHDRQFQGLSHRNEPAVYDLGKINIGNDLYYVELGKVIPFDDWIVQTKQDRTAWNRIIDEIGVFFWNNYATLKGKNSRTIVNEFIEFLKKKYDPPEEKPEKPAQKNNDKPFSSGYKAWHNAFNAVQNQDPFADSNEEIGKPIDSDELAPIDSKDFKTKNDKEKITANNRKKQIKEKAIQSNFKDQSIINILNKISIPSLIALLKGVVNYMNKTGKPTDFHAGNFGVISSNNSREPDTFVFFDI